MGSGTGIPRPIYCHASRPIRTCGSPGGDHTDRCVYMSAANRSGNIPGLQRVNRCMLLMFRLVYLCFSCIVDAKCCTILPFYVIGSTHNILKEMLKMNKSHHPVQ